MILKDFEKKLPAEAFIKNAFSAFENLQQSDNGKTILRLRKGDFAKKLIEEILPIAIFLKYFKKLGVNLHCQYFPGDQSGYDAKMYCEGTLVENHFLKSEYSLEVSLACHPKDYLMRECLEKGVPCFGGDGIERLRNGTIESVPIVTDPDEIIQKLANWIESRLTSKENKGYPDAASTFLIIPIFPDILLWPNEWTEILQKLKLTADNSSFCDLFICNSQTLEGAFVKGLPRTS